MALLRTALVAVFASACETSVYYPVSFEPLPDWVSACADPVDATVVVENATDHPVDVHELLPNDGCTPSARGTVPPGETTDLGVAVGSVWRIYDADSRDWLGTFVLADGENVLVVP